MAAVCCQNTLLKKKKKKKLKLRKNDSLVPFTETTT